MAHDEICEECQLPADRCRAQDGDAAWWSALRPAEAAIEKEWQSKLTKAQFKVRSYFINLNAEPKTLNPGPESSNPPLHVRD